MFIRHARVSGFFRSFSKLILPSGLGVLALLVSVYVGGSAQEPLKSEGSVAEALRPFEESAPVPELALLMSDLQRLTHKLALSASAGNAELSAFYLHESLEQLQAIQEEAPEYENLPIAVLIDRMARPAYEPFKAELEKKPLDKERLLATLDGIIQSCNACHAATQHGFIQITRGTDVNPFNQSFLPRS